MDTKDKAIIWVLYLITGAIIIGIAIKIIDANFANIIYWLQERFNINSRQ